MTIFHDFLHSIRISIHYNHFMRKTLFICALLVSGCVNQSNVQPHNSLEAYYTSTPENTSTPDVVIADTPLPTSTPITYVIQSGDTLSALAEKFKVSQDELRAANPEVDPNNMSIGTTIMIPDGSTAQAAESTPTPVPVPITQAVCHPTADNGLWCFALIHNNTSDALENVTALISLTDQTGSEVAGQPASLPLDILPPNTSLPVYTFFANTSADTHPQVQLLSALQLNTSSTRYLPAKLENTLAQIDSSGRLAQVSGQIHLPAESKTATQVWVAAVAYDKEGLVIGVKRWEGGAIQPGMTLPFNFFMAGIGGKIDSVEFAVEARP
jgi:LysM repeat protein